jgi:hypothetical protein
LAIRSRDPVCERWSSFAQFCADVGERPSWRHLLIRDDPTGAFEPGNARWRIAARYRWERPRSDTLMPQSVSERVSCRYRVSPQDGLGTVLSYQGLRAVGLPPVTTVVTMSFGKLRYCLVESRSQND